MPEELVNVTIDGMPVSVPKGMTIIEAAKMAGVLVPHYCYHPSLPSPAVCRMCLVEVEKAPKLMPACVTAVSERGDRAYIGIAPEHPLDHTWAGNVVDLCPVGSLISKDFLHKARAWDLDKTASICTGCSQGCNVTLDTRENIVVRIRPRPNLAVNSYFMCDHGRMNYRWLNRGDRIEAPLVRQPDGSHRPVDWD